METGKYINPYTDFGFKKLFGTSMNKELTISLLNSLLKGEETITDIQYDTLEHFGIGTNDRRAIFDLYCKSDKGGHFIVEMQKAEQKYFKDRSVFYSSFPIREQAIKGKDWDFKLEKIYTVGILNFVFPDNEYPDDCYHHEIKLMDVEDKHVFYDKLTYIYLEMPKFKKTEDQLETMFDKWLYALSNLPSLLKRPKALQERVFNRLFEQAEIARFSPQEIKAYEESLMVMRDLKNVVDTAEEKGIKKGIDIGKKEGIDIGKKEGIDIGKKENTIELAKKMKAKGIDTDSIIDITGLSKEKIERL